MGGNKWIQRSKTIVRNGKKDYSCSLAGEEIV